MQAQTPSRKKNTTINKIVYNIMLLSILHSSFVAPAQDMIIAYFNKEEGFRYKGFRSAEEIPSTIQELGPTEQQYLKNTPDKALSEKPYNAEEAGNADIKHGFIGVTSESPLDDVSDNIFKVVLNEVPRGQEKVFLTYELYGLQDYNGVTRSINDRLAAGGHIIKQQKGWTLQREEIDAAWLHQGENRIMFGIPQGINLQYQVKNLRIEFEKTEKGTVLPLLTMSNPDLHYIKDNNLYIKGFVRKDGTQQVTVSIEGTTLPVNDGEFEGFLKLTEELRQRKFAIVKAVDADGLIGQEIINFDNLIEADKLLPMEAHPEKATLTLNSAKGGVLKIEGASITIGDSALTENKQLSITHLRRKDVAPMASGMINVTKGGSAYRFLPDGTKFNKMVALAIGYDEQLIPKGYKAKDIKTFYFNTHTKSWVPVKQDTINQSERTVYSSTDHFTDYINGIIQTPESPETAGFTPTMMSGIKAADPSSEITLISPPEVSQKGEANISYPLKIPSGRNGMQPQLALQYNSDGGSGWLGQGWNINIPAISMDTRWGVPEINNTHETVIYTLGGEQLMYPKFSNADNVAVDWMPNRQYDSTSTHTSTQPRLRIPEGQARFTPRKQGSFAKIERMGNDPASYYWKVTNTDGTISWYGGHPSYLTSSQRNTYVLRQGDALTGNIVYWALFMTEDVHLNTIKYTYLKEPIPDNQTGERAPLSSGIIYNIHKINYTGYNNNNYLYEIEFRRSAFAAPNLLRKDVTIDARLGVKIVDACNLTNIFIRRTGASTNMRRYFFKFKEGEFQKSLLEYAAEYNADNVEFYRHTFDYYNDVRKGPTDPMILFGKPYNVPIPEPNIGYTLGVGNWLGKSQLGSSESIEAGWNATASGGLEIRFWDYSNNPHATLTLNFPVGESFPREKGFTTMADIDGNGLEDIIYKTGNGLQYFAHYFDEMGNSVFSEEPRSIDGITNFSSTKGKTKTMFLESHSLKAGIPYTNKEFIYSRNRSKSESTNNIFFADGNGDGLLDIVKDKQVLFNQHDSVTGGRKFTTSSQYTPNMLITASVNQIADVPHETADSVDDAQGYDAVRVWIAPKDGVIRIQDLISISNPSPGNTTHYSIETAKSTINNGLPFRLYLANLSTSTPINVLVTTYRDNVISLGSQNTSILQVERGQKIFFRITKNASGISDEVTSNPSISYQGADANLLTDENLVNHTLSRFQDGFILSEDQVFEIKNSGCVDIYWNPIAISPASDSVTYTIIMETDDGDSVQSRTLYSSTVANTSTGSISVQVNQQPGGHNFAQQPLCVTISAPKPDKRQERVILRFEVNSTSNLLWKNIQWKPKLTFTPDQSAVGQNMSSLPVIKYPVAKYSIYKTNLQRKLTPLPGWTVPNAVATYGIKPNKNVPMEQTDNGSFTMVVKKGGVLLGKRTLKVQNGIVTVEPDTHINLSPSININTASSQFHYSVGYYINNSADEKVFKKYLTASGNKTAILGHNWTLPASNAAYAGILVESNYNNMEHLGPMHKEWGQFFYNDGMEADSTDPPMPSDDIGTLINPNIGTRYGDLENAFAETIIDPNSPCLANGEDEGVPECLEQEYLNALGLPQEGTVNAGNIDSIDLDNILPGAFWDKIATPLLNARAFRNYLIEDDPGTEQEKWIGLFDTQYVKETKLRSGSFTGSEFDNVFPSLEDDGTTQLPDFNTGMQAINRNRQSVSVSKSIGWSPFSLTKSNSSYSYATSDFMDINGDRYPDMMSSSHVQLSNMTGGHKDSAPHLHGHLGSNTNRNLRLTLLSDSSEDAGRGENGNDGERTDQGNPSTTMGVGIDANLDGENKEEALWMDLNGDGLPDRISKNITDGAFNFGLNSGGVAAIMPPLKYGVLDTSTNEPTSIGLNLSVGVSVNSLFEGASLPVAIDLSAGMSNAGSTTNTTLVDMNGDGLPDLLNVGEDEGTILFNTGNGFTAAPVPLIHSTQYPSLKLDNDNNTTSLSASGSASYYFGTTICCAFLFFYFPILHLKAGVTASGNANLSVSNSRKAFKDFNGDGYTDYVQRMGNSLEVYPSTVARTNKLKTVTNPLKGSFTVDYEVQKIDEENPHPKWAMTKVTVNDGYDMANDGEDEYVTTYSYENGKYDRRERAFYGYETIKSSQHNLRTLIQKYHNRSYFLNGLLKESFTVDATDETQIYSRTENIYEIRKLNGTNTGMVIPMQTLPLAFDTAGNEGRGSAAVVLTKSKNYFYELSSAPQLTSEVNFTYDHYGRVITYQNLGNITNANDNYTTTIAYGHTALESKHILNVPSAMSIGIPGIVRKRETLVDNNNGNILAVKSFLTSTGFVSTTMLYDTYGNLVKKTFPNNTATSNDAMSYTYTYDPVNFYKIIKVEDAFGYTSETSYTDPLVPTDNYFYDNDKVTVSTDIAGNKTLYTYDRSGRLLTVRGPKENLSSLPATISFAYYLKWGQLPTGSGFSVNNAEEFVPVAVTSHYDKQQVPANTIDTYTFIDGLARPMQVKKDISINTGTPQAPTYQEFLTISGWTEYDALGRAVSQKLPHLKLKANIDKFLVNTYPTGYAGSTEYDAIDRPVTVYDADGSPTTMEYSINTTLKAMKTLTKVENGANTTESETYTDVNGRMIRTNTIGVSSETHITTFSYNAIGELTNYKDASGLITSYKYDWLGRKTEVLHPDSGKTTFYYDNASNLTRIQTANLQVDGTFIDYTYQRNRLSQIKYPDTPTGENISNVKYTYGAAALSGANANQRGRLIQQKDATGFQDFDYGNMGEMIYNKRTITAPNIPTRVFTTTFSYDSWNRLLTMKYPDGETVNYSYDLGGNLNKVVGKNTYIARIDYDHFEQRTYMRYGNNTETFYTYTPSSRRLKTLNVKTANQQNLFNNVYSYDLVGNVTKVDNTAGFTANNMGGKYTHNYTYDKLNRLIDANGSFDGSPALTGNDHQSSYTLNMQYNKTHGIVNKTKNHVLNNTLNTTTNGTYGYFQGTHRVQTITDSSNGTVENFTYDKNGNVKMKQIAGYSSNTSYLWDESNRLRVALLSRSRHHYLYDAGGERVLKGTSNHDEVYENGQLVNPATATFNGYTTYPSAFMVIDPNGIYSNHYYAGSQRIVSRVGEQNANIFLPAQARNETSSETATEEQAPAFDEAALRDLQIADLQQYLTTAGAGTATFEDYNPSTYQEEELALQEELEEEAAEAGEEEGSLQQRAPAATAPVYFYHPDHLGTSTFLTDMNGVAYQFFLNLPFGETMAEQHAGGYYKTPFLFTGKEKDDYTGLHYFGARYYDSWSSIWMSVDPLAEEFPNWNPYNYTMQNPINLVDPTGMYPDPPTKRRDGMTQGAINYGKRLLGFGISLAVDPKGTVKAVTSSLAKQASDLAHKDKGNPASYVGRRVSEFVDESEARIKNSQDPQYEFETIKGEVAAGLVVDGLLTKGSLKGFYFADDVVVMSEKATTGVSVIGPRANYREFAKQIGANFLDVTDEAWTMRKNVSFLQGVVKRGDDVLFSVKYNPARLDPNSVLAQEIRYLQKNGYSWDKNYTKMSKK